MKEGVRMTGDLELAQEGMAAILRLMGRDPETEPELRETPERAVRALLDVGTYSTVPDSHADTLLSKRFKGGKRGTVCVGPIHFDSLCEHHLLPFSGTACVAYLPQGGEVVGLSKIPRLVAFVAGRPQLQERMTRDIVDALERSGVAAGARCRVVGKHSCMAIRGAKSRNSAMITESSFGALAPGTGLGERIAHSFDRLAK